MMDSIIAPAMAELRVLPNGVDFDTFHPGQQAAHRQALGLIRNMKVVLFAGQGLPANEFKDYATFVRALALLGALSVESVVAIALVGHPIRRGSSEW